MNRLISLVVVLIIACSLAYGQTEKPEQAAVIIKASVQQAGESNRNVLVIFHASWCGWCKRLDAALGQPEIKAIIDAHYVVTHLDVMESETKKALENPGGNELMKEYGGEKSGLPFYVFLSSEGKKIADSNALPKNQSIGYPASAEEIAAFGDLLKQTAPRMSDEHRGQIIAYLQKNAPR